MSPSGQPRVGSAGTISGGAEFSLKTGQEAVPFLVRRTAQRVLKAIGTGATGWPVYGGGQLRGSSISLWHRPVPRLMIHALRSPGRCCRHVYIYTTGKAMCGLSRTPGRCRNDGKLGSGVSTSSLVAVYEEVWGRLLSWSSVSPC